MTVVVVVLSGHCVVVVVVVVVVVPRKELARKEVAGEVAGVIDVGIWRRWPITGAMLGTAAITGAAGGKAEMGWPGCSTAAAIGPCAAGWLCTPAAPALLHSGGGAPVGTTRQRLPTTPRWHLEAHALPRRTSAHGPQQSRRTSHASSLPNMGGSKKHVKSSMPGMQMAAAVAPPTRMEIGLITIGPSVGRE